MSISRPAPVATAHATSTLPAKRLVPLLAEYPVTQMFQRQGPFPAVTAVKEQSGPWDAAGATRTLALSDGGQARERLVRFDPEQGWLNEIQFTDVFRLLVSNVHDEWSFEEARGSTYVDWQWRMNALPGRRLIVSLGLQRSFSRYMQRMLDQAMAEIDARLGSSEA
jgi:hypothetical protein